MSRSFGIRSLALGAFLLASGAASAQDSGTLRFGGYGGSLLAAEKVYWGEPFQMLTGARVEWTATTAEVVANKLIATKGRTPPFDLVLIDDPFYSLVRVRGLVEPLDPAAVPNLKEVAKEFRLPNDLGTCVFTLTLGIVYNKEKFQQAGIPAPTRWQDLANPKLSGHVGTQTMAASAPKYLLAAYAIEAGDAPTNWDRAIDAVAKIKFHSFSSGVADLMAKIEAGDVWAAPITNGRAYALVKKGLPVEFVLPDNGNGTKGGMACAPIIIPKGSRAKALAQKFISFALTPGAQFMQAVSGNPYGPVINSLDGILEKSPKLAAEVAWGESTRKGLSLAWDETSIAKFPGYVEAWNRKVQK